MCGGNNVMCVLNGVMCVANGVICARNIVMCVGNNAMCVGNCWEWCNVHGELCNLLLWCKGRCCNGEGLCV